MKSVILLILLIFTLSCNGDKEVKFTITKYPKAEVINVGHLHKVYFLHCTEDFLIVSGTDQKNNALHVYSLPNLQYLNSEGQIGNASNEIKNVAQFCSSESPLKNFIYILGYSYTHLNGVTIDKNGVFNFVSEMKLKRDEPLNRIFLYDEKYLIHYNHPKSIKKRDIQTGKVIKEVIVGEDINNQLDGNMNANRNYAIYVARNQRKIKIYTVEDFSLITTINGMTNPNSEIQYSAVFAGKEQFYAFIPRDQIKDKKVITSKVEVYDYKGNPIKQYVFEVPFSKCVVDEYNGYIYGYIFGEEDKFVKYKI